MKEGDKQSRPAASWVHWVEADRSLRAAAIAASAALRSTRCETPWLENPASLCQVEFQEQFESAPLAKGDGAAASHRVGYKRRGIPCELYEAPSASGILNLEALS